MDILPFQQDELDLIWSEGAIYNIGFERGINEWYKFLKKGGFIAVTEASWFTKNQPDEIRDFWEKAYPEIDTISQKVKKMEEAGYVPIATFILPEECWTKHFYFPQINAQEVFLKKYPDNKTAQELLVNQRHEADLYHKYILWLCLLYRQKVALDNQNFFGKFHVFCI